MSDRFDIRPADLSAADDERIQIVASRVVASAHAAKFQMQLIERTRHNHHFLFLDPGHAWHGYYQYWVTQFSGYTPEQWQQHRRAEESAVQQERERRAEARAAAGLVTSAAAGA